MQSNLRLWRERLGLSQAALADRVGVTRQCIIALEQGRWSPNLDLAYRLAAIVGRPVEVLFPPPGGGGTDQGEEHEALDTWLL